MEKEIVVITRRYLAEVVEKVVDIMIEEYNHDNIDYLHDEFAKCSVHVNQEFFRGSEYLQNLQHVVRTWNNYSDKEFELRFTIIYDTKPINKEHHLEFQLYKNLYDARQPKLTELLPAPNEPIGQGYMKIVAPEF